MYQYLHYRGPKRKREKISEKIYEEIIAENFPDTKKEIGTQIQTLQRGPCRINPRRNMLRNILIKLIKIKYKEKIFKSNKEKQQQQQNIPQNPYKVISLFFQQKLCRPEGSGRIYLK